MAKKKKSRNRKAISRSTKSKNFEEVKKQNKNIYLQGVGVLAIIVLAVVAITLTPSTKTAAIVNGETITVKELDQLYNRVPEQIRSFITKETLLDQIISEKVLLQEASKQGIIVNDEEVSQALSESIFLSGRTESDFKAELKSQGITINEIEEYFKKQIAITKLLNASLPGDINASDLEEASKFTQSYLDNLKSEATIVIFIESETDTNLTQCILDNNIQDQVIFIYSQQCPHCEKTIPSVIELEKEGYSFYWADAADEEARTLIGNCLKEQLSGYAPQFICSITGETHTGELTKEQLKDFVDQNC